MTDQRDKDKKKGGPPTSSGSPASSTANEEEQGNKGQGERGPSRSNVPKISKDDVAGDKSGGALH